MKSIDDILFFRPRENRFNILRFFFGGMEWLSRKLTGKHNLNLYYSYFYPKSIGRKVDNFVKNAHVDCIISTTNTPFIFTSNIIPLVIITDATVKLLYREYASSNGWSKLFLKDIERSSLKIAQKANLIVSSSSATTHSLLYDYKIPESKIATIPFGANIENEDIRIPERIVDKAKPLNFLFVGRDWERKGGGFAVEVCDKLVKQNIKVKLSIVGCVTPQELERDYLTNYIFLDKNKDEDFNKLKELYEGAHFFMLFSKAEMYGIVFCEAAAYGLPVITYSVGGINDIVVNEKTGIMLQKGTTAETFASEINALVSDPEKYHKMSGEARKRYETLLNWQSFMDSLKIRLNKIIVSY